MSHNYSADSASSENGEGSENGESKALQRSVHHAVLHLHDQHDGDEHPLDDNGLPLEPHVVMHSYAATAEGPDHKETTTLHVRLTSITRRETDNATGDDNDASRQSHNA